MSALLGGGSSGRKILTANINYYVSTTGSDNNNGLTPATAWATLQHAMSFIASKIDIAGHIITVNIGAGSFAGFGTISCVGEGAIYFVGAGSGSTTITPGPNDGVYNFGECYDANFVNETVMYFDAMAFAQTAAVSSYVFAIYTQNNSIVLGNPFGAGAGIKYIIPAAGHSVFMGAFANGDQQINTPIAIDGSSGGLANIFADVETGANLFISGNVTLTGAPVFSTFIICVNDAWVIGSGSYTGAATGKRFNAQLNGNISNIAGRVNGPNYFPGNAFGTTDVSSTYDGIPGSNVNYSIPITGFSTTLGNTDTEMILDPAGTLATGTVVMAPSPIDGQKVRIRTSQIITTLTINGSGGQTIAGYTAGTLALGGVLEAIYKASNTTWYF